MFLLSDTHTGPPSILDHDLQQYFPELLKFESTPEMQASELYKKIRPEVDRILNSVVVVSAIESAEKISVLSVNSVAGQEDSVSAVAWNIERGIQLDGIIDALKNHKNLQNKDLLL